MGYLVGEVVDLELIEEELEELITFITRSGRVSKPSMYLHPEGKGKEKMLEEEAEIEVQKKAKEEEERRENEIFTIAIRRSHLFLIEQLSRMAMQVPIMGLLLMSKLHKKRFMGIFRKSFVDASITLDRLEHMVPKVSTP